MINFRKITEDNFEDIINMKRPENEHYLATNVKSLAQAWLYKDDNDVFPFAIYNDNTLVGFMMIEENLQEQYLYIWRIMFPNEYMNKGYGSKSLKLLINLAKASKKYNYLIIDYLPDNKIAKHVYEKLGFKPTGEISNGEVVLRLDI